MSYDTWLEQPRADKDEADMREEQIDQYLTDEYDEACGQPNGWEPATGLHRMDATDVLDVITGMDRGYLLIRDIILAAHSTTSRHTVETAVAAMIGAGRKAYVADKGNRERAKDKMEEGDHD